MNFGSAQINEIIGIVVAVQALLMVGYLKRERLKSFTERAFNALREYRLKVRLNEQQALLISKIEKLEQMTKRQKELQRLAIATTKQSFKKSKLHRSKTRAQRRSAAKLPRAKGRSGAQLVHDSFLAMSSTNEIEKIRALTDSLRLEVTVLKTQMQEGRSQLTSINAQADKNTLAKLEKQVYKQINHTQRVFSDIDKKVERENRPRLKLPNIGPNALQLNAKELARFEKLVKIKEDEAMRLASLAQSPNTHPEQILIEKAVARVDRTLDFIGFHIERIKSLLQAADPDVDKSYHRLIKQLKNARTAAESSARFEATLESEIAASNTSDDKLIASLRKHRRQNILIDQQLFRAGCVVSRIYAAKLLLNALPNQSKEHAAAFKRLMHLCSTYLKDSWLHDVEKKTVESLDYPALLSEFEDRIYRAYIELARDSSRSTSKGTTSIGIDDVNEITSSLQVEIAEQRTQFELWDAVSNDAFVNEKELVHLIASKRSEEASITLASLERSLEVVIVVGKTIKTNLNQQKSNRH